MPKLLPPQTEKATENVPHHRHEPDSSPEPGNTSHTENLTHSETSEDAFKDANIPPWRFAVLSIGLALGLFIAMLDSSIVATSLVSIGEEFQETERINWVALAYTLGFLGCAVFFARMADVVGRRNAFIAAFIIFFSFSLGCAFAQDLDTLIACRAFQGVGGAGLYSVTMIIFPELSPQSMRAWISSLIGMVVSTAGVLGPVLGGVFTQYASWRWVFWINGPIGFLSMILFYFSWPKTEYLPTHQKRCWKDLDVVGSFLLVAASVLVVFSFQNAGETGAIWNQTVFIAPFVIGSACCVALVMWEGVFERFWSHKMAALPLVLFRNHVFTAAMLNTVFLGFSYIATLYAVPLRLQVVNEKNSIMAGIYLLPMLGGTGIGSALAGALSSRSNRLCETMTLASILVTLGCALETTASDSVELEPKFIGFLVFVGFGYGMSVSSATMLTALESPISEHAPAQGIIAQSRMLGGSIGIAMSSAVLAVKLRFEFGSVASYAAGSNVGLDAPGLELRRKTYNDAFTETMMVCAIVGGIGVLFTLGTFRRGRVPLAELRARQITDEVERRRGLKPHVQSTSSGQSA